MADKKTPSGKKHTKTAMPLKSEHHVQFYHSESHLLVPLSNFISEGLISDEVCIVIATTEHLKKMDRILGEMGIDTAAHTRAGTYMTFECDGMLNHFMSGNKPDKDKFYDTIGKIVREAAATGKPIRAYGEMVATLWKQGNKDGMLELEYLWNDLATKYAFSLYCAYPSLHFIMDKDVRDEIHSHHPTKEHAYYAD